MFLSNTKRNVTADKVILLDQLAEKDLDGRKSNSRKQLLFGANGILVTTYKNSGTIIMVNVITDEKFKLVNRFPLKNIRVADSIVASVHCKNASTGLEEIQVFHCVNKNMFQMELPEGQNVHTILCGKVVVYVTTQNEVFMVDLNLEQKPRKILADKSIPAPVSQLCSMKGEIALIASQFQGIVFNAVTGTILVNLQLPAHSLNTFITFCIYDDLIVGAIFSSIILWDIVPGVVDIASRVIMTESIPTALAYFDRKIYVGFAGSMINSYTISGEHSKTIAQPRINTSKGSIKDILSVRIKDILVHNKTVYALYESGELVIYWLKKSKSKKPSQTIFRGGSRASAKFMTIFTDFELLCVVADTQTKNDSSKPMLHLFSPIKPNQKSKKKKPKPEPVEDYQLIPPIPKDEMQRMRSLYACSILDTEPEAMFDRITVMCARLLNSPICLVSISDKDRQWFKSGVGIEAGNQIPRPFSFCSYCILDDAPDVLVVSDTLTDARFKCNILVTKPPFVRFYAGAPLILKDGARIGTLCVIDVKPKGFSIEEKAYLVDLAAIVSDLIESRRTVLDTKNSHIAASSFSLQLPLQCIENCVLSLRENYGKSNPVWNQIQINLDAAKSLAQNNIEIAKGNTPSNSNYVRTNVKKLLSKLSIATQSMVPIKFNIDPDFPREIVINYNIVFNALLDLISSISQLSTKEIQVRFLVTDKKYIKNDQSEENTDEHKKTQETPDEEDYPAGFEKKSNDSLIRVEINAHGLYVGEQVKSFLFVQPFLSFSDDKIRSLPLNEEWQDDSSSSSLFGVAESVALLCYTVKSVMSTVVGGDCGAEVGNIEGTLFWIEFLNHLEMSQEDDESVRPNESGENPPSVPREKQKPTGEKKAKTSRSRPHRKMSLPEIPSQTKKKRVQSCGSLEITEFE